MSAAASWHEGNARYLAAATAWVRALLEAMAGTQGAGGAAAEPAAREMALCESAMDPPPALAMLAELLGLSPFEQQVLLLCVAMELDTRVAELCAQAPGSQGRGVPSFALAMAMFPDARWDAMSPERPLRWWKLVELQPGHGTPLLGSPLRADERIVHYIKGLNHLDERLLALVSPPLPMPVPLAHDDAALLPSQQAQVARIVAHWQQTPTGEPWPAWSLLGADTPSKLLVARHAAAFFGRRLHRLSPRQLPGGSADLEMIARLWQRECMLLPVALFIERGDDTDGPGAQAPLHRFLARSEGLFFIDSRDMQAPAGRPYAHIDIRKPSAAEQRQAWAEVLGPQAGDLPASLAAQFNLDIASLRRLARQTPVDGPGASAAPTALWDACRASVRPALDALAQRIDVRARWQDLVLPAEQTALLRQISAQVRRRAEVYHDWGFARRMNRGLGVSALFDGPSGVGKTMAAEVIANDLRLDLYRIDLSCVISKYIGETEGNLRRVFDAAEDGGAILFFDECDALFGKRSEVKDSHDRFANTQTNYLLQRIESYQGLAILATNMKSALDTAFVRRLRFIIDFPFPGPEQRRALWQKAFPPDVPQGALDWARLGRLNLSGGNIHNAALGAAFGAAEAGTAVTMAQVLAAVRTEYLKLGRPVNAADFALPAAAGGAS
ncbi:ATPase family associated with various cellular activities (AAA) [Rubrivivax sp. A210]|uniref:ATP-binding protein n=1 Tax=Rubrivivax sp. A210 TaxID=2772301 RepID=UPI0019BC5FF0|nr:ATP-binding protein [Rubrivivax sp. A210]CAD5367069.1 ATPase family associated with various cellular activities (AAA) [Rubrivivax sp. A210]